MKTTPLIAAAVLQLAVLGYMAGEREWVVRTGQVIRLRTAPVDPRDVMRGDYVRLDYEIARVPHSLCRDGLATAATNTAHLPRDTRVFATLKVGADGLAELVSLSDRRPASAVYLRGRLQDTWPNELRVRYGLEALFMEQGTALKLEEDRNRDGVQVPAEMEVALSSSGLGVLKRHHWSALGIGLDLQTQPRSPTNQFGGSRILGAKVRLMNTSEKELALIDLPEGRSFALEVQSTLSGESPQWVHAHDPVPTPSARDVIRLKPGQVHTVMVPLTNAYWFITQPNPAPRTEGLPRSINDLAQPWSTQFRLVYRPPVAEACQGLPQASLIWHGRLQSRAFHPTGGVD